MRTLVLNVVVLATFSSTTNARVWQVKPDGSGDAPTIQAAINSATAGDVVQVAQGTYTWTSQNATGESMIRLKPGVNLIYGPEHSGGSHILDAEMHGRVLICDEPGDVRVEGLSIQNGMVTAEHARGAGVLATGGCRLDIVLYDLRNNVAEASGTAEGGGIYMEGGSLWVFQATNNVARGEIASGGGVFCVDTVVYYGRFEGNLCESRGGLSSGAGISALRGQVINTHFVDNQATSTVGAAAGGGLHCDGSNVERCLFLSNSAMAAGNWGRGGGICAGGNTRISNSVLIGNEGGGIAAGSGVSISTALVYGNMPVACHGGATWSCSVLFRNEGGDAICGTDGGGNVAADPLFCWYDPLDCYLRCNEVCHGSCGTLNIHRDSPCFQPPEGCLPLSDYFFSWICGPTDTKQGSWTSVKQLFR